MVGNTAPSQGTHSPILASGCTGLAQTSTSYLIIRKVLSQPGPLGRPVDTEPDRQGSRCKEVPITVLPFRTSSLVYEPLSIRDNRGQVSPPTPLPSSQASPTFNETRRRPKVVRARLIVVWEKSKMFLSSRSPNTSSRTLWQISTCQKEGVGEGREVRRWPVSVCLWSRSAEGDRSGWEKSLHLKLRWD